MIFLFELLECFFSHCGVFPPLDRKPLGSGMHCDAVDGKRSTADSAKKAKTANRRKIAQRKKVCAHERESRARSGVVAVRVLEVVVKVREYALV